MNKRKAVVLFCRNVSVYNFYNRNYNYIFRHGGTYNYAKRAISLPVANISAWHYLLALIALCATESLAFANYFSWIFRGMGMEVVIDNRIIAAVMMFIFVLINYRGVKVSGKWQNAFVFFFWGVSAVWLTVAGRVSYIDARFVFINKMICKFVNKVLA